MTDTGKKLLHLLAVKALWPRVGRDEFKTELHLNAALENTLAEFDAENGTMNFCKHCGVVDPTYKEGRCSDCGEPSK